jgi:uncharacterized protein (TIGR03437 family)
LTILLPWVGLAQAPKYNITTVAGNLSNGFVDNVPATQGQLSNPCHMAVDGSGNLFIADSTNHRIRKVDTSSNISTVAGNGTAGWSGDGAAATSATLNTPCGVALDSKGNIYIADTANSYIREVSSSNISSIAGTGDGPGVSGDGQPATQAQVNNPNSLAFDAAGNLYIADSGNNSIRKIDTGGKMSSIIGANGSPLNNPLGITVDAKGAIYIADTRNHRVRKIVNGAMTTIAGNGTGGYTKDGIPATQSELYYPKDVAVDAAGNVYIVDSYNFRIRMITTDGTIYTIAGNGRIGSSGDGGPATSAQFNFPAGIALGPGGVIYVSDTQNNVVRMLTPTAASGAPSIDHAQSVTSCGGFLATAAPGAWVEIYGSNLATDTHLIGGGDFTGNQAPTSWGGTSVSIAGQLAVLAYVGQGQVNAQVPLSVGPGQQQLIVNAPGGSSSSYALTINPTQPGLCGGAVNGTQYLSAVLPDGTYVLPTGSVSGVTSRPAHPGETITFFGNGFGPVSPPAAQGQVVQQNNQLNNQFQVSFGGTPATTISYSGLAPQAIGLYQFNVVLPNVSSPNPVPVTFTLGGVAGTQTLYTLVQ